jgi:WD40 repeat protein
MKKTISIILIAIISLILIPVWLYTNNQTGGNVMIASLSSDAHYAITTDDKDYAILWDLQKHTKKIISRDANAYSAYWIKSTPYFMWQNWKTETIHVINVNSGQDIKTFHPDFIVFGQAMSADLKYNVASDIDWNIWVGNEHNLKLLAPHYNYSPGFYNKLINFTFLSQNELITSGFSDYDESDMKNSVGIDLWDLDARKSLRHFLGNQVETFATISPDGKYVVAGDMDVGNLFVWDLKTGKQKIYVAANQPVIGYTKDGIITDAHTITPPTDYYRNYNIISVQYIDAEHYLVFNHQSHYTILYQTLNPKPLKYLDVGTNPWPATFNQERDQSMDTSPSAHILVMAKDQEPGIMVYHYDPSTQTLTKVWDGK